MPPVKIEFNSNRSTTMEIQVRKILNEILSNQMIMKYTVDTAYTYYNNKIRGMKKLNAYELQYSFPASWVERKEGREFQIYHVGVLSNAKRLIATVSLDENAPDPLMSSFWDY